MKVALIVCPCWTLQTPPLGAPLLKSYLSSVGHECIVMDMAVGLLDGLDPAERRDMASCNPGLLSDRGAVHAFLQRHEKRVGEMLDELSRFQPDAIGFTLYWSTEFFSEAVARLVKDRMPHVPIVFGGPQAKKLMMREPSQLPSHVDAFIPGEGEAALAALLKNCRGGRFDPTPGALVRSPDGFCWAGEAEPIADLDGLPCPDFGDLPLGDYLEAPVLVTYFSRGCYKKCSFCDVEWYWGKWRNRSGRRVYDEIATLFSRHPATRQFVFCDSLVNADMNALGEFCDLATEGIRAGTIPEFTWKSYSAVRPEMTAEFFEKMFRSGCRTLWYGVESGSQKVLNLMKKGQKAEWSADVLKNARTAGIKNEVLMMVGFPGEREEDFAESLAFVKRNAPYIDSLFVSDSFTYIGEGTPLFKKAFDHYAVDPGTFHIEYWRTKDGDNTYPVRIERYERLLRCAQDHGVRLATDISGLPARKTEWTTNYERFLRAIER